MAKVFITQIPHRRDPNTNQLVPSVNIGPAHEHGDVVVMLPPQASFYATADLIEQVGVHLEAYSFDDGDALIAMGDPSVIAASCAYLGARFGRFSVLKWDRQLGRYLKVTVDVRKFR